MNAPDILIIGGGAAGLSAAATAAGLGLSVELLDERPAPGGNSYAGVGEGSGDAMILGHDYVRGPALLVGAAEAKVSSSMSAWRIERNGRTFVADEKGDVRSIAPRPLLIAGWLAEGSLPAEAAPFTLDRFGQPASRPEYALG